MVPWEWCRTYVKVSLKSTSFPWLLWWMDLPSKSSLLILAWVSGLNKSSFICFTLAFRPILSWCKASLIKSRIPIGLLPTEKEFIIDFYIQMPMKNIKYGTLTYQKRVRKETFKMLSTYYRKGCILPKIYHLPETNLL